MTRSAWALGLLLVATGCGTVAFLPEPPGGSTTDAVALAAAVVAAPDCVGLPQLEVTTRKASGIGYIWVGYNGAAVGSRDLAALGSGDGYTFGAGFKVGDSRRSFVEIAYEKTFKHLAPPTVVEDLSGYYERMLFGGRTSAAPQARMEHQPRAYVTYGLAQNNLVIKNAPAAPDRWAMHNVGYYLGLGVEFPFADTNGLGFDVKYHMFTDEDPQDPTVEFENHVAVFSVLWTSRF